MIQFYCQKSSRNYDNGRLTLVSYLSCRLLMPRVEHSGKHAATLIFKDAYFANPGWSSDEYGAKMGWLADKGQTFLAKLHALGKTPPADIGAACRVVPALVILPAASAVRQTGVAYPGR